MGVDEHDTHHRLHREAGRSAGSSWEPRFGSPRWASTFSTRSSFRSAEPDAADPEFDHDFGKDMIPWIVKNGKAVAHRFAEVCVLRPRGRGLLARRRYVDAYWEANIDLTDVLAGARLVRHATGRSGPTPRLSPPANSCTTRTVGAGWRSLRWSRAVASSRVPCATFAVVHRRAHDSFSSIEEAVVLPYGKSDRHGGEVPGHRPGVSDPRGARGRRGPAGRCLAVPPHRAGFA